MVALDTLDNARMAPAAHGSRRFLPLPSERIHFSYNTRFVSPQVNAQPAAYALLAGADVTPSAGDVVIARVTEINNHKRIETENSRKAILFPGALVAVAYGDRYAADQFLAHVPTTLDHCHLVAAGGLAGIVDEIHATIEDIGPTKIEPLGLLSRDGAVVNLYEAAPYENTAVTSAPTQRAEVFTVLGSSMNAGKSTVAAALVNGLTKAGYRVGAGKITGTGAGNDRMLYFDAGAHTVIDFTDYGYATTFRLNFEAIRSLAVNMVNQLSHDNTVVVLEIADGIYQEETAQLLRDPLFQSCVDHTVFAAVDALGAAAGVNVLASAGLPVTCVSGLLTASPLATREAAAALEGCQVPVCPTFDLTLPYLAQSMLTKHGNAQHTG